METVIAQPPMDHAPETARGADWNEASRRLRQFLAAHRLACHIHRSKLAHEILATAQERHRHEPHTHPVHLTLRVAQERIDAWFTQLLRTAGTEVPSGRLSANGYVALWLTRGYEQWPRAFCSDDVPPEMRAALRESSVETGPDLEVSSMTSRGVDFGPMEILARETWQKWNWREVGRAAAIWAGVYAVGYGLIRYFIGS